MCVHSIGNITFFNKSSAITHYFDYINLTCFALNNTIILTYISNNYKVLYNRKNKIKILLSGFSPAVLYYLIISILSHLSSFYLERFTENEVEEEKISLIYYYILKGLNCIRELTLVNFLVYALRKGFMNFKFKKISSKM